MSQQQQLAERKQLLGKLQEDMQRLEQERNVSQEVNSEKAAEQAKTLADTKLDIAKQDTIIQLLQQHHDVQTKIRTALVNLVVELTIDPIIHQSTNRHNVDGMRRKLEAKKAEIKLREQLIDKTLFYGH